MNLFESVNMTKGNPVTQVMRFTLPMLLGNIAQQLYNTVDSIIVGRYIGDRAGRSGKCRTVVEYYDRFVYRNWRWRQHRGSTALRSTAT